jgi:RHS repeat-associated protein
MRKIIYTNILYNPFGMIQPERTWESDKYRYGFGSHEKDDEVKGIGNHINFGEYGYDTRLGRRWQVDPMTGNAPGWSPYRAFFDNPIYWIDPSGLNEDHWQIKDDGGLKLIARTEDKFHTFFDEDGEKIFQTNEPIAPSSPEQLYAKLDHIKMVQIALFRYDEKYNDMVNRANEEGWDPTILEDLRNNGSFNEITNFGKFITSAIRPSDRKASWLGPIAPAVEFITGVPAGRVSKHQFNKISSWAQDVGSGINDYYKEFKYELKRGLNSFDNWKPARKP